MGTRFSNNQQIAIQIFPNYVTGDHIDDPASPADCPVRSADGLIRRLGTRYLIVLTLVAFLVVVDQAIVQPLLIRLDRYAPAINLSGRQRMLSQRLTKTALTIERASNDIARDIGRRELRETLDQWSTAHVALREGNTERGIHRIDSKEISLEWQKLEPHYVAMTDTANFLISNASDTKAVGTILRHEPHFLASMEHIVKLMEIEAAREVQQLRYLALAIAVMIVALLVGLGWLVVRPANRAIRSQVDQLETRVELRTAELATALDSLQLECAERHKAESKSRSLAAQLAHADRVESIGHLAVGLAHELNHPLGAIANYSEACDVLLTRGNQVDHGKLQKFVIRIRDAAMRAGQIVRRMRNFVQPESNDFTEIDIRILVDEVIALCQPEIDRHQVDLCLELDDAEATVSVDAIQIQQVLVNLVQNALQAMANTPTTKRRLVIRSLIGEHDVQIDVVDSGPGISASDVEAVFEPFQTTKQDGLGIGLSICRSIVENHRGTIWVESSTHAGVTISFVLPLIPLHAARLTDPADSLCC